MHPSQAAPTLAIEQFKASVRRLPAGDPTVPLVVFAGDDPVKLAWGLGETGAALLVRLRSDRCFSADADPTAAGGNGRPRRQGAKVAWQDPTRWPNPTAGYTCPDPLSGQVQVRAWSGRHSVVKIHQSVGSRKPRPLVRGTVILVDVSKLPGQTCKPRALWLCWHGPGEPDRQVSWRASVRRFDLEQSLRFFQQTLTWIAPRVRLPEQAERWTWRVLLADTHSRLVRPWVSAQRLPWARRLAPEKLTPCRVRRAFSSVRPLLDTPASAPKPCGRSPGRPRGRRSGPAPLSPLLKTTA